jgi:hypothetical protein
MDFNIPSLSLHEALHAFSRQAGVAVTILPGTPADARSVAVRGHLGVESALIRLLGKNHVPYRFSGGALIVGQSGEADATQVLPAISVTAPMPNVAIPADSGSSGLSVIDQDTIRVIGTGDKDPMRLLRVLPNVNFDNSQFKVGQSGGSGTLSEQDLTPERVSISGGKVYDNKVLLDGMDNRSVFDVMSTSEGNNDTIGIHNPMSVFANSDILQEVAVYDSNVPARYSGFTGGVIDMRTRDPGAKFGGSLGYARQSDKWVHYRNEWPNATGGLDTPQFTRNSYDVAVDVPVEKRFRTLVAASRIEATQRRVPLAAYDNESIGSTTSTRSSYLASVAADLSEENTLFLKGLYAPYAQEYVRNNTTNSQQETVGNNYQLSGEFRHAGDHVKANLTLGLSSSGYDREAPGTFYLWSATGSKAGLCGAANCNEGGYGDISDEQRDFQAKGDIGANILGIDWSTGLDFHNNYARRNRKQTNYYYYSPAASAAIVCLDADDPGCITGEQVLRSRMIYLARDYSTEVNNIGYWGQAEKSIPLDMSLLESIDLRGGIRADYSDFTGKTNWAPRLSTTLRFPSDVALTLGANRYYSTNMLTYALYEKAPNVYSQTRIAVSPNVYNSADWTAAAPNYLYRSADLRTPYSDERTAALTLPLLWGESRVKYVVRRNRDEVAMELYAEGGTTKRRPNNDGWTDYKSFSVEWTKSMENHAFLVNGIWSDTKRNNFSYLEAPGDESTTRVYYNGAVVPRGSLPMLADNFAQPLTLNAAWTSKWLDDALTLNLTGKYRFAREDIGSTGKTINVGGTNYTVYDKITRNPLVRFDATASYRIDTWSEQQIELLAYAENIFNARSHTAEATAPYERGRAYWFGIRYLF